MKKFLALILAVLMLGSILAACGGNSKGSSGGGSSSGSGGGDDDDDPFYGEDNISLRVWAPDKAIDFTKEVCDDFIAKYPDKSIKIDVQVQGEAEAATQVLNDKTAAADVFGFISDQFNKLMKAQALYYVFDPDDVIERNSEASVASATGDDGKLYAFPETDDNGYFFVYDKSVISDEEAKTLEGVLAACRKAGRRFIMDAGNGYYSCVFPFTGGLTLEGLDDEGTQQFNDYEKIEDDIVDTLEAFANLFHEYKDVFLSAEVAKIPTGLSANPRIVAAGIDGTWDLAAIKKALGDDFGVAPLPTINVKGTDLPMKSLHGYKYIGVNTSTKFPNAAMLLADYLTSEEVQLKRAEVLGWGPSNENAKKDPIVADDPALHAIIEQAKNSVPQVNMADTFWTPMGTLGNALWKNDDYSRDALKKSFEKTIANIREE